MAMNAGDHRANRRQLNVIVNLKANLICRSQRVLAVWAAFCNAGNNAVRMGGKRPKHPGTAVSPFRRAALGPVGLAPSDGGTEELSGVLGDPPSLASSSAIRRVNSSICAACASTSAISSSLDSLASSSRYILRLNQRNPLLSS